MADSCTFPEKWRRPGQPTRVNRIQAFLSISPLLKGRLYWYALRQTYDCCDNLFDYRNDVKMSFRSEEPERQVLMNKKERDYLQNLPEQITIYRGMTEQEYKSGIFGVSWTLRYETAEFFAETYIRNFATNHLTKVVHELVVNKSEVIAFFNERKEFEIIYIQPEA